MSELTPEERDQIVRGAADAQAVSADELSEEQERLAELAQKEDEEFQKVVENHPLTKARKEAEESAKREAEQQGEQQDEAQEKVEEFEKDFPGTVEVHKASTATPKADGAGGAPEDAGIGPASNKSAVEGGDSNLGGGEAPAKRSSNKPKANEKSDK